LQQKQLIKLANVAWYAILIVFALFFFVKTFEFISKGAGWESLAEAAFLGLLTLLRVLVLLALATVIWLPLGIMIGLNPGLSGRIQALAQFLAAFPTNLLFPWVTLLILQYKLHPDIWLSVLMILGTQWYILFNVIAGASVFPTDLKEVAAGFGLRGHIWWKKVMLPGVFPYYVTGAITAAGGAWNASIIAETVSWGDTSLKAQGLGSYIAEWTAKGDLTRITLGVGVMSVFIVAINRLLWRPLYDLASRRLRLD
jgi:NitT/TauT family transport system permease protein